MLRVEVVYAKNALEQTLIEVEVEVGSSAKHCIEKSQILSKHEELVIDSLAIGIFSKNANLDTEVTHGDRIEIYRELTITPMQKRRLLAKNRGKN